jgi:Uma2 family endonuclease
MSTKVRATVEDLYELPDVKAEIINGELVVMSPTGAAPNYAAGEIFASLREYSRREKRGRAVTDNAGFKVDLPHRDSLSPDAAFYTGVINGMKFFEGAPVFAAEVRSAGDYGAQAEKEIAQKRADYFASGTLVLWDVDLLGDEVVKVYRVGKPDQPTIYRRGEMAEAEPAVTGWTMPVDTLFE